MDFRNKLCFMETKAKDVHLTDNATRHTIPQNKKYFLEINY